MASHPLARPHTAMAVIAVVLIGFNVTAIAVNRFAFVALVFWIDVVAAVAVPVAMLTPPRLIHWLAGALFAIMMLAVAFACACTT